MLAVLREMRAAVDVPLAAQPATFRSTDETPCFTRHPQFPDELEPIERFINRAIRRLGQPAVLFQGTIYEV